ncbi:MAG: T9SS type A sorting domain-containing protein [Bacteroidia bacterium]|nr:T9SS type A sorting domain-containing protein [Bacteroidia bacterium]
MLRIITLVLALLSLFPGSQCVAQHFGYFHHLPETELNPRLLAFDSTGNMFDAGTFAGKYDFDPGTDTTYIESVPKYESDMYIRKFDETGKLLWARRLGSIDNDFVNDLVIDRFGNLYITGQFNNTVDFDLDTGTYNLTATGNKNDYDMFVAKYDNNGALKWAFNMGSGRQNVAKHLALDRYCNVYLNGEFTNTLDFDLGTGATRKTADYPHADIFTAKYDSSGKFQWVVNYYAWSIEEADDIAVDTNLNVYTIGHFASQMDVDPGPLANNLVSQKGSLDIFVQKLDSNGNFQWGKRFGGDTIERGHSIYVNPDQSIRCVAQFGGTIDINPGSDTLMLPSTAPIDLFHVTLSDSGTLIASAALDFLYGNFQYAQTNAIDDDGYAYQISSAWGTQDFDPGQGELPLSSNGERDIFVQKLSPEGHLVWAFMIGSTNHEHGYNMWVDHKKNVYIHGSFYDSMDFDPGPKVFKRGRINSRYSDHFFMKLTQDKCSDMTVYVDSLRNETCSSSGYASVKVKNARSSIQYKWSRSSSDTLKYIDQVEPGLYTVSVTSADGCFRERNVRIKGNSPKSGFDLSANLIATDFTAGSDARVIVDAANFACTKKNAQLELILDTKLSYQSSTILPDTVIGNKLIWKVGSLNMDSDHFRAIVTVTLNSTAKLNDRVILSLNISPVSGDNNSSNNDRLYQYFVKDKKTDVQFQLQPLGSCTNNYIDSSATLTYGFCWRNTASSNVEQAIFLDSLGKYIDPNSVEILGTNKALQYLNSPENVASFHYPNIQLANASKDDLGSYLYLFFKCKVKRSIPDNTLLKHRMEIRLDDRRTTWTEWAEATIVHDISKWEIPLDLGPDTGYCKGESFSLQLDAGPDISKYSWNDGSSARYLTVNQAGTYSVSVVDTDGCSNFDLISVKEYAVPTPDLGKDFNHCSTDTLLHVLDAGTGASYVWSNGYTSQTLTVNKAGQYKVTVTSVDGCSSTDSITIGLSVVPELDLGEDFGYCSDHSFQHYLVAGSDTNSYWWNTRMRDSFLLVDFPGTYWVRLTTPSQCEAWDTIVITEYALPELSLGSDTALCSYPGTKLEIAPNSPFTNYQWSNGSSARRIQVEQSGTYRLDVLDSNNCQASDSIQVEFYLLPMVDLGPDLEYEASKVIDTFLTLTDTFSSYLWSDGSTRNFLRIQTDDLYWVEVEDKNGCLVRDSILVEYKNNGSLAELRLVDLQVYPNPADESIRIHCSDCTIESIALRSMDGKTLLEAKHFSGPQIISSAHLSSGAYVLEVYIDSQILRHLLIINH